MKHLHRVSGLVALALLAACARQQPSDPRFVAEWMRTFYGAMRAERLSPPVASRLMTYATSAMYAGLAVENDKLPSLRGALNGFPELPEATPGEAYDGTLTALAAERVVLDSLLREALATTRSEFVRLVDSLAGARSQLGIAPEVRARSESLGVRIGTAIVRWSRTDGFDGTRGRKYVAPAGAGLWVNDAPANIFASQNLSGASDFVALNNPANLLQAGAASDRGLVLNRPKKGGLATVPPVNMSGMSEPYWGEVRPFALRTWSECAIPAPPAFSTDTTSEIYRNAREVYAAGKALSPEQRTIALYWADNAGESGTPVGHWLSIASQMISQRTLTSDEAIRLVVQVAAAQADAFIASWGYKYQYNLLRPRTYIRAVIDSTWEPLIPTPPFPEYPSGHSTQSAAAATVIAAAIGEVAFDDSTSMTIGHAVRRFPGFTAAAAEAGMSRIYGGIHFPVGNVSGRELGECIGRKVLERFGGTAAR
jgi:membrane-associated phospholipid phosphatase